MTEKIDRRQFLYLIGGAAAGGIIGEAAIPLKRKLNEAAARTGLDSGNANTNLQISRACDGQSDPQACVENYETPPFEKFMAVVVAPPTEEGIFRAVPSVALDLLDHTAEETNEMMLSGRGFTAMGRRDFLAGGLSAIVFGLLHNVTEAGINTHTIPASQTFGGLIYWFLQRKFGIASNITAHALNNFRAVNR